MEMGKGAVTVTQDIQNVEKCKLNNHQPKIWEVTSTLSPSCLNLSLELSINHISIVHFLPLLHSLPLFCNLSLFYLCLPLISPPILHSLIHHFSTSLIQSISSELLIYSVLHILSATEDSVNFLPSSSLSLLSTLLDRIRCYLSIKGPRGYLIKGL